MKCRSLTKALILVTFLAIGLTARGMAPQLVEISPPTNHDAVAVAVVVAGAVEGAVVLRLVSETA